MNLDAICRKCRGNAQAVLGKPKCGVCRLSRKDYVASKLEGEIIYMAHLWDIWIKCKRFNQRTTGTQRIDNLIERLFGKPHNNHWREPYYPNGTHVPRTEVA